MVMNLGTFSTKRWSFPASSVFRTFQLMVMLLEDLCEVGEKSEVLGSALLHPTLLFPSPQLEKGPKRTWR